MSTAGVIALPEPLSESRRAALIKLLADEDRSVYQAVRQKILSCGPQAADWLRPHLLSSEPALRRRAQELVHHFERQASDNRFLAFCLKQGEDLDLEQGAWLLARTRYPDINVEAYQALLDNFVLELHDRIESRSAPKQMLMAINHYLFVELGFSGNEDNFYDPENSYLNRVLDRRTGNPISLCLIYMLVARRLRLPITGVGMPGYFICRYQSIGLEVYIDAFNLGKLLSKADCVQYLVHGHYNVKDEYLAPVSPRRMLLRMCSNLHQIYTKREQPEEVTRLQRYLVALAR